MLMCSRCHKRPAVVFISQSMDTSGSQGLCLVCAKELGIKPVNDLMEQMGITEEQLEAMADEMNGLMAMDTNEADENGDNGEEGFTPGGAATFPSFLQNIFIISLAAFFPIISKHNLQIYLWCIYIFFCYAAF